MNEFKQKLEETLNRLYKENQLSIDAYAELMEFADPNQALQLQQGGVVPSACPNCKEPMNTECACLRNKCVRCLEPVGNITFTVCDDCWDKKPTPQH